MPENVSTTGVTPTGSQETAPQTQVETTLAAPQTPSGPIELNDDALVTWNGAKEPVKFSNLRGLQSQFTKVSQTKAKLERQYNEAVERNKALEAAIQRAQSSQRPTQQADPFEKIRQLPYLTGAEAAETVSAITAELGRRDQILQLMAHKIAELQNGYSSLSKTHSNQSFEKKLSGWVESLGLDPEFVEDAKIFYLAHDWDDDSEFPDLYKAHLEKRASIEQRKAAARREAAKTKPFVPGKGGLSATSGEKSFAGKSAQEQADELWPLLQGATQT